MRDSAGAARSSSTPTASAAHRIAVFGSVARGEARPDSDLDVLAGFEPGTSLLEHVGLFQDLQELLGVGADIVARSALKPRDEHIRRGHRLPM